MTCRAISVYLASGQVDFLKLLYDKLLELHLKHADTPEERHFPRPSFKVRCKLAPLLGVRELLPDCKSAQSGAQSRLRMVWRANTLVHA